MEKKKSRQQLSFLTSTFYDYQDCRKSFSNRVRDYFNEKGKYDNKIETLVDQSSNFEAKVEKLIKSIITDQPIYKTYLSKIKGIGPVMAANLVSRLCTVREFERWKDKEGDEPREYEEVIDETEEKWIIQSPPVLVPAGKVTQLWSYCGLAGDTSRERGKQLNYDPVLKELFCFKLPSQFFKAQSHYYNIFKEQKRRLMQDREDIEKEGHASGIARTITGKVFASHFWYMWRSENDFETPKFYHLVQDDAHTSVYKPFVEQPEFKKFEYEWD